MIVNAGNLKTLFVAFKAAFQGAFDGAPSDYQSIATVVPSSTGSEEYGWLGSFPSMREWLGDRVVNGMKSFGYTIKNKIYELTVAVPRPAIEDDQYGVYTPMMAEMGRSTAVHPDELVFTLLKAGTTTTCYDGQYFFDTDHPVLDANGAPQSQSNYTAGAGAAWYLLDTSRALKPLIFQKRKAPNFVAKTQETDENVFNKNEFVYGVDCRDNAGFGFWQMAYCSKATLDAAGLTAAWTAFCERKGDYGRPLGMRPTILLVPPSLEIAAKQLVEATNNADGSTNVMKGLVTVKSSAWLA